MEENELADWLERAQSRHLRKYVTALVDFGIESVQDLRRVS